MKKIFFLATLLSFNFNLFAAEKVIYLVSAPRSYSTVLLRHFHARGDCEVFNEPSQYVFDHQYYPEATQLWFAPFAYKNFQEVQEAIFFPTEHRYSFVKEMSFATKECLLKNKNFIQNSSVQFVFLVRDPREITASFYTVHGFNFESFQNEYHSLVGTQDLWDIYTFVKNNSPNPPIIIHSRHLLENPEKTLEKLCEKLDIPWKNSFLFWTSLSESFDGKEWHEIKKHEYLHLWHGNAIKSTCFLPPKDYSNMQLKKIAEEKHYPYLVKALRYNEQAYKNFLEELDNH